MNQKQFVDNKTSTSWFSFRNLALSFTAVLLGLIVGWLDLHVTEVLIPIMTLMSFGLLFGFVQPRAAWRWALMLALGIPVMEFVAVKFSIETVEPVNVNLGVVIIACAFTLLGTYLGVLIRYLTHI